MADPRESAETPFGSADVTAARDAVALIRAVHNDDEETAEEILRPYIEEPSRAMLREVLDSGGTITDEVGRAFMKEMATVKALIQALTTFGAIFGNNLAEWAERPVDELLDHYAIALAGGDFSGEEET